MKTNKETKKPQLSSKGIIITIISTCLLLVVATWVITFSLTSKNSTSTESSKTTTTKISRSLTGNTANVDKRKALSAAEKLLKDSLKNPKNLSMSKRLNKLNNKDFSVIDPSVKKDIRFVDSFKNNKTSQSNTYQSLITIAAIAKKSSGSITPYSDTAYKEVYLDQETGQAFIPLEVFTGSTSTAFSLNMVYIDGEWKFSPYSLIDAVKLSAVLSSSSSSSSSSK